MRRLGVVLLGLVSFLGLPADGGAAPPAGELVHERFEDTFEEPDFCGTGETVTVTDRFVGNLRIGESGGDPEQALRGSFSVRITFSFEDRTVVLHEAGRFTNEIVSGQESGVHTHRFTEVGLRGAVQGKPGGRLVRDAGRITFEATFDEDDEVIDEEILDIKGPHELFTAEEDFFCPTITEALGIG